jgi:DNA-directed RNA polymerase specialized sigma24 family protein
MPYELGQDFVPRPARQRREQRVERRLKELYWKWCNADAAGDVVSALTAALDYDVLVAEGYGQDFLDDLVRIGRKPQLTPDQRREAIKRRDVDGEPICEIARSYGVHSSTICRLRFQEA